MKNMPMGLNSTPFISYREISIKDLDLLEDAWGLNYEFSDVIKLLDQVKPVPGRHLTKSLIDKIRRHD